MMRLRFFSKSRCGRVRNVVCMAEATPAPDVPLRRGVGNSRCTYGICFSLRERREVQRASVHDATWTLRQMSSPSPFSEKGEGRGEGFPTPLTFKVFTVLPTALGTVDAAPHPNPLPLRRGEGTRRCASAVLPEVQKRSESKVSKGFLFSAGVPTVDRHQGSKPHRSSTILNFIWAFLAVGMLVGCSRHSGTVVDEST